MKKGSKLAKLDEEKILNSLGYDSTHYTLQWYYINENLEQSIFDFDKDVVNTDLFLYAVPNANSYKVTIDLGKGDENPVLNVTYNEYYNFIFFLGSDMTSYSDVYLNGEMIPSTGRWTYSDTDCTVTLKKRDFYFIIYGDGYSLDYYSKDSESIEIPDTYDDKPVLHISSDAFVDIDKTKVVEIKLPSNLEGISRQLLSGFTSLNSIKLPQNLRRIGMNAFSSCESLESIVIPDSVEQIDEYAFSNCTSLKSINIPKSLSYIGVSAFESCKALTSVAMETPNAKVLNSLVNAFNGKQFTIHCSFTEDEAGDEFKNEALNYAEQITIDYATNA